MTSCYASNANDFPTHPHSFTSCGLTIHYPTGVLVGSFLRHCGSLSHWAFYLSTRLAVFVVSHVRALS